MSSKFFFFTDPSKLQAQGVADAFGPQAASGDNDLFRVTDMHPLSTGAPAIAVCEGNLCAQRADDNTLTLILKPSAVPPFEAPMVAYFVYKGIDPNSLLDATGLSVLPANAGNDLSKKVAELWPLENGTTDLTGSHGALGLDRDAAFTRIDGSTQINPFTDADPIERLFAYPHKFYQIPHVSAGDVIGTFAGRGGCAIVLHRLGYRPKLEFARKAAKDVIEVATLPPNNGGQPWQPDDRDFFAHWHLKEQVLAYLDPAAYFGAFVQARLYKNAGGSVSKVNDVYDDVLKNNFQNANVAWLDIRNNHSYSYNLFGLYGNTLRFVSPKDASQTADVDFRDGRWPLRKLQLADVPGSRHGGLHRTTLYLPAGLCVAPAVLISKGFATRLAPERAKQKTPKIAASGGPPGYLPAFRIGFPAKADGSATVFTASYTRVNLYETAHPNPQPAAPLYVPSMKYLDGIFRPLDLQLDENYAANALRFDIYPEEILVDLGKEEGLTYAASVGIAQDPEKFTLIAFPSYFLPNRRRLKGRQPLPGWADTATTSGLDFLTWLTSAFKHTSIVKVPITPAPSAQTIDTLMVRHEPSVDFNPSRDKNYLEEYCFVVLPWDAYKNMLFEIYAAPDPDRSLPAFLTVASSTPKYDAALDESFREIQLQCTDFAAALPAMPGKTVLHQTALSQKVYDNADS